MNPLTKTFVVLVTLFAVVETAIVVPLLSTQDKWKSLYQEVATSDVATRALLAAKEAELAEFNTSYKDELNSLRAALAKSEEDKSKDNISITETSKQLAIEKAERIKSEAAGRLANANLERVTRELASYTDNYVKMLAKFNDSVTSDTSKAQRIAVLQDELRRTINKLNEFKELSVALGVKVTEVETVNATLVAKLPKDGMALTIASPVTIEGLVTGVRKASNNVDLVSLNIGRRDQIKEGMELTITRDGSYIGKLLITVIDTDECAGYINHIAEGASVLEGDMAYIQGYNK